MMKGYLRQSSKTAFLIKEKRKFPTLLSDTFADMDTRNHSKMASSEFDAYQDGGLVTQPSPFPSYSIVGDVETIVISQASNRSPGFRRSLGRFQDLGFL